MGSIVVVSFLIYLAYIRLMKTKWGGWKYIYIEALEAAVLFVSRIEIYVKECDFIESDF